MAGSGNSDRCRPPQPPKRKSLYPNLSHYAANRAQTVQSEPNGAFSCEQLRGEPERNHPFLLIPMMLRTSELLRDVERGVAVYRLKHILGTDGHHQLEEATIYKAGPRKGEVYARGVLEHINGEHNDLDLGTIRW